MRARIAGVRVAAGRSICRKFFVASAMSEATMPSVPDTYGQLLHDTIEHLQELKTRGTWFVAVSPPGLAGLTSLKAAPRAFGFQDQQGFLSALNFPPPPVMRLDFQNQIIAGAQTGFQSGLGRFARGLHNRRGDEHDGKFTH